MLRRNFFSRLFEARASFEFSGLRKFLVKIFVIFHFLCHSTALSLFLAQVSTACTLLWVHPAAPRCRGFIFSIIFIVLFISPPWEERAVPGGTAIPGQPVAKVEQAPTTSPRFKNQFNIEVPV